ncbi:MAG TPA: radical SAM protein [Phycisphaerae bacterium]|nr:radical SAM protein [Phycisphaerae bacterium]
MIDRFGRTINYLRVSVTDRCNLRCAYCMPPEGVPLLAHADILSFEEIVEVVVEAVALGVRKVRLTGGEPLVRRGIVELVGMLGKVKGIEDLAMTTNGTLLGGLAAALKAAGLMRVNVSLDAIDPAEYARITRGGDVRDVLAGIDAALSAGLRPVKLNCVVLRSSAEANARDVAACAAERGLEARFIHRMDLKNGSFSVVEGGTGGDCRLCNRLRLTSDGYVRPCLFSDLRVSVRELGARQALRQAVTTKPPIGTQCSQDFIKRIGG